MNRQIIFVAAAALVGEPREERPHPSKSNSAKYKICSAAPVTSERCPSPCVSVFVPITYKVARDLKGMTKRYKDENTGLSVMDADDFRTRFPDGRMFSNPGLATPEHGRRLLHAAVRDATETLRKFISGEDIVEEAAMAAAMAAAAAASKKKKWQKPRWGDGARASGTRGKEKGTADQRTKGMPVATG